MKPLIMPSMAALLACSWLTTESPSFAPIGDRVERVATLRSGRAVHTATALPSGQVLFVGGMEDGGGSLASAELFDPRNNRVEEIGAIANRRAGHTATLLANGRVLVAGGYDGQYLSSVELFDPSTRRFSRGEPLGEGRSGHTATLLDDGRVLLVGGVGLGWTFLRSAEIYDPASGRFEAVGDLASPREGHSATLLADGRVLIVGGHVGRRQDMQVHATAELFDPRTRRFDPVGSLGTARHKHDAVRLPNGQVLILGGADRTDRNHFSSTEVYNPVTQTFVVGPSMSEKRYKILGTSLVLANGDVLVGAGARRPEILDSQRLRFRAVAGELPEAYRFATATALPNGDVLIAGGYSDGNRNTAGVWRFAR
jgi:hypothetical protein